MSLASAQGLIGTAIGVAALGLALGFVTKAARGDLFDGRDRRKDKRRSNNNIGFDFGGQGMSGRKQKTRRMGGMGVDNIFDLGLTQRPARQRKKFRSDVGSDFNIFAV